MILLEPGNRILEETCAAIVDCEGKREPCDVRLCDFDDVLYRVQVLEGNKDVLCVSMNMPCYQEIEKKGGADALKKHYGDFATEPIEGFDLTLKVDLSKEHKKEVLIQKLKLLKANILGGVFDYFFTQLVEGKSEDPFKFSLRSDCIVYMFPGSDRCTVVFSLDFSDKAEREIAKIFLKQFPDVQRRSERAAPPLAFGEKPPLELKKFNIEENEGNVGYVSFAVLKSHVDTAAKKDKVISSLQIFRNYLQYHIKCAKSYFHSCMRKRVVQLLQVLNRARAVTGEDAKKGKKTMSGKTFTRS